MKKEKLEELRELWKVRILDYKESGKNMSQWCKENDLKVHQLRYWLEKYDAIERQPQPQSSKWLSVEVDTVELKQCSLTVDVNGISIEVKPGFDPSLLRDVVKALKQPC